VDRAPAGFLALLALCGVVRKLGFRLKQCARPDPPSPALLSTFQWRTRQGAACSFAALTLHADRLVSRIASLALGLLECQRFAPRLGLVLAPIGVRTHVSQPRASSTVFGAKPPNRLFRLPFTPAGVKGRGGRGGRPIAPQETNSNETISPRMNSMRHSSRTVFVNKVAGIETV